MLDTEDRPKEIVMSYIRALDNGEYEKALVYLNERVRIRGPAGETFGRPTDFIEMLRKYRGKYSIRKVFADGKDVCVLYDLATIGPKVYMSSWYTISDDRIVSIETVFDPRAFGSPPGNDAGRTVAR